MAETYYDDDDDRPPIPAGDPNVVIPRQGAEPSIAIPPETKAGLGDLTGPEVDDAPPQQSERSGLSFGFRPPEGRVRERTRPAPTFTADPDNDPEPPGPPETTTLTRTVPPTPNALHIMFLHQHPETAEEFDAKFGPGAAMRALMQPQKQPSEKQAEKLAPPQVTDEHVIRSVQPGEKGDLPPELRKFVARSDTLDKVRHEEAATTSLLAAKEAGDDLEGWDHEKEVEQARAMVEAWSLKAAQSELLGGDREIALRGLRAAEARLKAAEEILNDKRGGYETIGSERGRMMVAQIITYQEDKVAAAEAAHQAALEAARPEDETLQGVLAAENARLNVDQQKKLLEALRGKYRQMQSTRAVDDPSTAGELIRSLGRGAFGQVPKWLGLAIENAAEGADLLDMQGNLLSENVTGKKVGKALQQFGDWVDKSIPQPKYTGSLWDVEDTTQFKFWLARSTGETLGIATTYMLPPLMLPRGGAGVSFLLGIGINQGALKEEIEDALAAAGKTADFVEINNYVQVAGTAIGLFDAVGGLLLLNSNTIKTAALQEMRRSFLGRIVKEGIEGAIEEGTTEAVQEFIQILAVEQLVSQGLDPSKANEYAKRIIEGAVAGGLVGGGFGATAGARNKLQEDQLKALEKLRREVIDDMRAQEEAQRAAREKTPKDVATGREAVEGRPRVAPEAGEARPERRKPPEDAATFLRRRGGVKDPDGELAAIGVPPSLINKDGLDPDAAREMLVEEGYILDDMSGEARTTTDDLYDILRRVADGERVVRVGDELAESDARAAREETDLLLQENAAILRELEGQLTDDGVPYNLTDMEEARVVRLVRDQGLDPFDAFERVALERYEETGGRAGSRGPGGAPRTGQSAQVADVPFAFVSPGRADAGRTRRTSGQRPSRRSAREPAGAITPNNVQALGDYLRDGGSLSRRAYPAIAQAAGVDPEEVGDLLDTAARQGVIKQDKRGRWRRQPGYEARLEASPDDPVASLNRTERAMTARLEAGKSIAVPPSHLEAAKAALDPMMHLMPAEADLGIVTYVKPVGNVTYKGMPTPEVELMFVDPRGGSFTARLPWLSVIDGAAYYLPPNFVSTGRDAIVHLTPVFDRPSQDLLAGRQYHELVHLFRRRGGLGDEVFNRLVRHAVSLDLMQMDLDQFLTIVGDPTAVDAAPFDHMMGAYDDRYNGRPDYEEIMRQEAVALMMELHYHDHYSTDDLAPVMDIVEAFDRVEFAGETTVQPGDAVASINRPVVREEILYRGEPADARGGLGHHYSRSFARAKGFAGKDGKVFAVRVPIERMGELKRSRDPNNFIVPADLRAQRKEVTAPLPPAIEAALGGPLNKDIDALGMYSALLRAARGLKQTKGTPEQMLAQLKAAPGVKAAEIEVSGIEAVMRGLKSVTRDEIIEHIELSRVKLMEAVYGKPFPPDVLAERAARTQELNEEYASLEQLAHSGDAAARARLAEIGRETYDLAPTVEIPSKWRLYSLDPSNPTYRETVVHLPSADDALNELRERRADGLIPTQPYRQQSEALKRLREQEFRSGHWSEPNAIFHLRTSIQPDAQGRQNFVVNELQSDWGQKIREGGVIDPVKLATAERAYNDQIAKVEDLRKQVKTDGSGPWDEFNAAESRRELLLAELRTLQGGAPGNPLVNTTDQWVNTGLRRALIQAVEADADYIAIASGETVISYKMDPTGESNDGMRYAYNEMYPKKLRDILKKLDKDAAKPESVDRLIASDNESPLGQGFTRFPLTEKVKAAVLNQGLPLFAFSGRRLPDGQNRVAKPGMDRPTQGLHDLVISLADALNIQHPRTGRMSVRGLGQHDMNTGMTRIKTAEDFEVFAHEAGHALEARYRRDGLRALMKAYAHELEPIASPGSDKLSEGFAEFMRRYITAPANAYKVAPDFFDEFEDFLDKRESIMLDRLDAVITNYEEWINTSSVGAVGSAVRSGAPPKGPFGKLRREMGRNGFWRGAGLYFNRIYTAMLDDLNPVKQAVKYLVDVANFNIDAGLSGAQRIGVNAANDAYKLLRLARNSYQSGHIDLMSGVRGYHQLEHVGPSFRDVLSTALGGDADSKWSDEVVQDFNSYLVSRRMAQEWERWRNGDLPRAPDKLGPNDHAMNIRELEEKFPQFADAAEMLYSFQRRLLDKAFDAGYIKQEVYDDLIQREDYVPVHRHMDDPEGGASGPQPPGAPGPTNKAGILQKFGGSTRDVVNPLESIVRYTYELNFAIARNDAIKALDALARAVGPGGSAIAERLPKSQMRATSATVEDVLKSVARERGMDPADVQFMMQAVETHLGDHPSEVYAKIWKAGEISEKGETIVYLWEKGERIPIRLPDGQFGAEMYSAITGLGQEWTGLFINALALPSNMLRAGVTLDPAFTLANYFRDQASAWILTQDHGGILPNVAGGAKGTWDAGVEAIMGGTINDLDLANSMGMIMGGEGVAGIHEARVKQDVRQLARKGLSVQSLNIQRMKFWRLTGLSETGTRISVWRNAFKRAKADGMSDYEAAVEATYSANDLIDFGRHGSKMLVARRLVTFLNAALQGMDRSVRTLGGYTENPRVIRDLISPYIKQQSGHILTIQERKRVPVAATAWARLVAISLFGAALRMLYLDDEDYQAFPEYFRDTHWMYRIGGQWVRIPKPFELGAGSLILERGIEAYFLQDEKAMERMFKGLRGLAIPPTAVPGMTTMAELAMNQKLGIGETFFTAALKTLTGEKVERRAIVPSALEGLPPEEQFDAYTSQLSRTLAEWTGISAMKIDHVIQGIGGSLGRYALDAIPGSGPKAEMRPEQQIVLRRFTADPARSSQFKREFWDQMNRDNGDMQAGAKLLRKLYDEGREDSIEADRHLDRMTPDQRAFALLALYGTPDERRKHPLNRALAVLSVTNAVRRELMSGELKKPGGEAYSPRELRQVQETIELLQHREARNAQKLLGLPGYSHMTGYLDTEIVLSELEKTIPDLAEEIRFRLRKRKVQDFNDVRAGWPDLKAQILDPDYRLREPSRERGRQSETE